MVSGALLAPRVGVAGLGQGKCRNSIYKLHTEIDKDNTVSLETAENTAQRQEGVNGPLLRGGVGRACEKERYI